MTRTGKIARLPQAVRTRLNQQLADGVPGVWLVDWLNSLPEVKEVLTARFEGREINEPNLSEWKTGGYLDWQAQQEMEASAREMAEAAKALQAATDGRLTDHLSTVLAGRYAQLLQGWNGEVDEGFSKKLKTLRRLTQDVATLRRGDVRAERLGLEQEQWRVEKETVEAKALELCLAEAKRFPEVAATFQKAFDLLAEVEDPETKQRTTESRPDGPRG